MNRLAITILSLVCWLGSSLITGALADDRDGCVGCGTEWTFDEHGNPEYSDDGHASGDSGGGANGGTGVIRPRQQERQDRQESRTGLLQRR